MAVAQEDEQAGLGHLRECFGDGLARFLVLAGGLRGYGSSRPSTLPPSARRPTALARGFPLSVIGASPEQP